MSTEPESNNVKLPQESNIETTLEKSSSVKTENVVLEETIDKATNNISNTVEEVTENAVETAVEEIIGEKASDKAKDLAGDIAKDISEELTQTVMNEVKESLGDVGVKASTLTLIIKYTMEAIEKTPVKGSQQLDFALRIIGDLIQELPDSEEKTFLNQTHKNGGIKDTIELVVDASKGKVNINQVTQVAASNFLQPCIDYIMSKCR